MCNIIGTRLYIGFIVAVIFKTCNPSLFSGCPLVHFVINTDFCLVFQSLAEFKMLNMSIKVSFGWMLGSSKNMIDAPLLRRIQLAVGIVTFLEVGVVRILYTFVLCAEE